MKFDGYGATFHPGTAKHQHLIGALSDHLQALPKPGPVLKRWGQTTGLEVNDRLAAWVGVNPEGLIYIEAKGETTPAVVDCLRRDFKDHSAARLDVAEDVDQEGSFEQLQALVRAHKGPRVKGGYVALPDDQEDGRTWAAGRRGGDAYIRVYEAGKHPDRVHLGRPHWTRLEGEFRPHYARDKVAAATMTPQQVWGLTAWSHRVGEAILQSALARYEPQVRAYSHSKTMRYIANTFRRHFEEMLANGEDIERTIRSVWEEEDAFRKGSH